MTDRVITDQMVEVACIAMAKKSIELFGEHSQGPWNEWDSALKDSTRKLVRAGLEEALLSEK